MFDLKQVQVSGSKIHLKLRETFKMKGYFGIQASSLSKHNLSKNKIHNPLTRVLMWSFLSPVLLAILSSAPHMYLLRICGCMEEYGCYWRHKWVAERDHEMGEQDTELKNMA